MAGDLSKIKHEKIYISKPFSDRLGFCQEHIEHVTESKEKVEGRCWKIQKKILKIPEEQASNTHYNRHFVNFLKKGHCVMQITCTITLHYYY